MFVYMYAYTNAFFIKLTMPKETIAEYNSPFIIIPLEKLHMNTVLNRSNCPLTNNK